MYGIVNKGMEEMVTNAYGKPTWDAILDKAGYSENFFISLEPYDDKVTYDLAIAASEMLNTPLPDLLFAFGEYWVLETGKKKYGSLMTAGGSDMKQFLVNLPVFHDRVSLIFPKLAPPRFTVTHIEEKSLHLHYYSHRPGLKDFVMGLISGIAKMYNTKSMTVLLNSRDVGSDHETFEISWE